MRRMLQVLSVVTVLVTAIPAAAQPPGKVEIDFPGAAAVEAGMSDPKPVDPDPEGRRRAAIVVPPGDSGTVYAMRRADGTTVVRLVSAGQPAPDGFKAVGKYRDGDRLTFNVNTMAVAMAAAATAAMHNNLVGRFGLGVRSGAGSGSLLGVVERNCTDIENDLGLQCSGSDRGPIWTVGVDTHWAVNHFLDVGLRADYTRPDELTIDGTGTFENIPVTTATRKTGRLFGLSGEIGYSPTPRLRLYGGGGAMTFDFDVTNSLTAFNQTETETQNFSGWGSHFYGGGEFFVTRRLSIFGEGGRAFLKDGDDFDERYSRVLVGVHVALIMTRVWR